MQFSAKPMKTNRYIIGVILAIIVTFTLCAFAQTPLTNDVPSVTAPAAFGDDIPGLNILPEKLRGWFLAILALSPFIGRAYHAVVSGGGFKKIISAIWLGTNTATYPPDGPPKSDA